MPELDKVPDREGVPELLTVTEGVPELVTVSEGVPDPDKVPDREGVPEPVGVTEDVDEGESVPYEDSEGESVYSGEEVLIDSGVITGDAVKELLVEVEKLCKADSEYRGLVELIKLADADISPEGEGLPEPPSDTEPKAEVVAVENASD